MKKLLIFILVLALSLSLFSCRKREAVLDEEKTYDISAEIHSLDIQISAADFTIESADTFSVRSNLKYLSVTEQNGVLRVVDEAKSNSNYEGARLTLSLPRDAILEEVDISTGACKMTVDILAAKSIELFLGAGDVHFEHLIATSEVDIEGGTGQITIGNGALHDLTLKMGMGALHLNAALSGDNELEFGVGEADITVLGSKEDYRIDIQKGLGAISIDGQDASDFGSGGNGQNSIEIEGGVGAIRLTFREE